MQTIVNSCAGLDVHKMMVMVAIRKQTPEGIKEFTRQFGTFKRDREQLCAFLQQHKVELAVMESTGVYWKSIYAAIKRHHLNG